MTSKLDGHVREMRFVQANLPSQQGTIQGYRTFDKVRYQGNEYFIKGRMSTGYAMVLTMEGQKVDLKPIAKLAKIKIISTA